MSRSSPRSTPPFATSSCWPAAACATSRTWAPCAPPAPPARSSRRPCTAASSGPASWRRFAAARLHVLDERTRHVGAARLLQSAPAGDPVELQHVVAAVRGLQHVDPGVVDAQDLGRLHAQARLL